MTPDQRLASVGIIGAGTAGQASAQSLCAVVYTITGLITAHTLLEDGFKDVQIITRDHSAGGVWSEDCIYPGLYINK